MKYVEAPEDWAGTLGPSVFLAGGITDCPDWQAEVVAGLEDTNLTVVNPRRADFPMGDPNAGRVQIAWEHTMLRRTRYVAFWFPCETLCPITLYELGAWSMTTKPMVIGVHPDYARKLDVQVQTLLVRQDVPIVYSIEDLTAMIRKWDE